MKIKETTTGLNYEVSLPDINTGHDMIRPFILAHLGSYEYILDDTLYTADAKGWLDGIKHQMRINARLCVLQDMMPEDDYERVKRYAEELLAPSDMGSHPDVIQFLDAALKVYVRGRNDVLRELSRIEKRLHDIAERCCEGTVNDSQYDRFEKRVLSRIEQLLGTRRYIFINGDPRGAMVKVEPEGIRFYEALGFTVHQDFGGYGYFV